MPKSDLWPGGAAMDSAMNMDSAGSCDSVIRANSACSDDSMDHLSAKERACLIYLEEMIESVEIQEDNRLSNDEPESLTRTGRHVGSSNFRRKSKDPTLCGAPVVPPPSVPEIKVVDSTPDEEKLPGKIVDLALIPPPSDFMDVPKSPVPTPEQLPAESVGHDKPFGPAADSSILLPPRSPPAVAPKPKKLPANIILKSHKSNGSDSSLNSSRPAGIDWSMFDPQKVHLEALRKLGLLRSEEQEPSPLLSPKFSSKTRKSWAAPPSQLPASPPASSTRPDFPPVPSAFCDPEPDLSLPPPTVPRKSATLERTGPRLSSINELRLGDLRNSRPRPASLGSRKEFLNVQGPDPQTPVSKEKDARLALPTQGKLLRSQDISVLISPRAENEEDRRDALRKLGLL